MNYHYCFSDKSSSQIIPYKGFWCTLEPRLTRAEFLKVFFPVPISSASRITISHTSSWRLSTYSPLSLLNLLCMILPFMACYGGNRFVVGNYSHNHNIPSASERGSQPRLFIRNRRNNNLYKSKYQHKQNYCEWGHVLIHDQCYCYDDISL